MSAAKGVALVTGSAQGIGCVIAIRLARDGFDVALNDVSSKQDQLRAVASDIEKIGRRTYLVPADVTVEEEVKEMVESTVGGLGGIDVMVANAGVGLLKDLVSTGLDEWERIVAVNARGTFLCYKYAATQMIKQGRGGRIIGACSTAGKLAHPLGGPYVASKFAIRGLTQTAALELARYKITVNTYAPGVIDTQLTASMREQKVSADKEMIAGMNSYVSRRCIKHDGQPEFVASVVSYLASEEAYFITGQSISVNGGMIMS